MWRYVVLALTNVSEERIASIFSVEKSARGEPARAGGCGSVIFDWWLSLQPPAAAGYPLANFSTLKMEAIRSSETSVNERSTQRHITEDILQEEYSLQECEYNWQQGQFCWRHTKNS
jgi:hypothetical protein